MTDLAVESILKLVLRHFGKEVDPNSGFPKLVDSVVAAGGEKLPLGYVGGVHALRKTRNCVMHDGTAQDPQAARALVARARSVLIRLTSDVFGVDLLNLRVTEFITSRRLRHALREADKRNVEGSYAQVASIAVWSFEFLMSRWSRFVASLAEGKSARTESPEPVVAAVSAGVHIPDLKRFRDATDQVVSHMTVSGRIETTDLGWQTRRDAARQREEARFALEFVSGLALQIEGRMIGFPSGDPYDDALPAE